MTVREFPARVYSFTENIILTTSHGILLQSPQGRSVQYTRILSYFIPVLRKMGQRLANRVPKRMLVFFGEDKCTSNLNTSRIKRIYQVWNQR